MAAEDARVYVGNLAMNVVNEHILAEVFNSALGELSRRSTWGPSARWCR